MSESASPREAFEQLLEGVTHRRRQELPALYAEDAAVDHPFRLEGPSRLHGREEVREHFAAGAELSLEPVARNVVVHETTGPEVIIAEFDYRGRVTSTEELAAPRTP